MAEASVDVNPGEVFVSRDELEAFAETHFTENVKTRDSVGAYLRYFRNASKGSRGGVELKCEPCFARAYRYLENACRDYDADTGGKDGETVLAAVDDIYLKKRTSERNTQ